MKLSESLRTENTPIRLEYSKPLIGDNMGKKLYVMPEKHPVREEYIGERVMKLIEASEEFKKNGKSDTVEIMGTLFVIDEKHLISYKNFAENVRLLSKALGVGDYNKKSSVIKSAKPDVLFLEDFTSEKELFEQLPFVEAGYIVGALREDKQIFATKRPIYEFCKDSGILIVPIDSEDLMRENREVDKKARSFKGDRKSKEFQDIENEFKEIVKKRSEFMLNEMGRNIDELGTDKTYIALIGEQHYNDFLEIPTNIELQHINKRLEELGTEVRYNENDY